MSATDLAAVENALDHCETLVLYKAAGVIEQLLALLEKRDLLASSKLVSCAEQGDGELLVESLADWTPGELSYMTTMIIRIGNRDWAE